VFNRLDTKFSLTSKHPCLTFGDQSSFESRIASYAAGVPGVTGSALGKCDAAKIKCVAKYVAATAKCHARAAASKSGAINAACSAKASVRLADGAKGCLDKAALQTDCTNAGSQAVTLRDAADSFVHEAVCDLSPGNAGCAAPMPSVTPTIPATATSTPPPPLATATPTEPAAATATPTEPAAATATEVPTATQTGTFTADPTATPSVSAPVIVIEPVHCPPPPGECEALVDGGTLIFDPNGTVLTIDAHNTLDPDSPGDNSGLTFTFLFPGSGVAVPSSGILLQTPQILKISPLVAFPMASGQTSRNALLNVLVTKPDPLTPGGVLSDTLSLTLSFTLTPDANGCIPDCSSTSSGCNSNTTCPIDCVPCDDDGSG